MKSKTFKTLYEKNGKGYAFDASKLSNALMDIKKKMAETGRRVSFGELYVDIAEKAGVSEEAVKNWRHGYNGPSDIEIVESVAEYLGVKMMDLLSEVHNKPEVSIVSEEAGITANDSKEIVREICNECLEVLSDIYPSDCFDKQPDGEGHFVDYDPEIGCYYLNRMDWLIKEVEKKAWYLSKEHYDKLLRLCMELKGFVYYQAYRPDRWYDIEPKISTMCKLLDYANLEVYEMHKERRELFFDILEPESPYVETAVRDMEQFTDEELDNMLEEFWDYNGHGHELYETIGEMIGMCVGKWFVNVLRHDFPDCFIN